jgi:hypothetical protein
MVGVEKHNSRVASSTVPCVAGPGSSSGLSHAIAGATDEVGDDVHRQERAADANEERDGRLEVHDELLG